MVHSVPSPNIQPKSQDIVKLLGLTSLLLLITNIIVIITIKNVLSEILFDTYIVVFVMINIIILWNMFIIKNYYRYKDMSFIRNIHDYA